MNWDPATATPICVAVSMDIAPRATPTHIASDSAQGRTPLKASCCETSTHSSVRSTSRTHGVRLVVAGMGCPPGFGAFIGAGRGG